MILAPVDAELGRGNAQIQFLTRSGTNRYTGSLVWSATNSALDANTWNNNRATDPTTGAWKPTKPKIGPTTPTVHPQLRWTHRQEQNVFLCLCGMEWSSMPERRKTLWC